jgi:hypothetical protein
LSKISRISAALLLTLLITMALTTTLGSVFAQEPEQPPTEEEIPLPNQFPPQLPLPGQGAQEAFVTVVAGVGGATFPAPGAYRYPTGEWFNLTAVPYQGYRFSYWVISGSYLPGHNLPQIVYPDPIPEDWVPKLPDPKTIAYDSLITSQNPLNVICGYGYNYQYQPVFSPINAPSPVENTVVSLLSSLGGTSKVTAGSAVKNAPGTYTFASGDTLKITATADSGYEFRYWIAQGPIDVVVTDNPADISCQEGVTYSYQPVFAKTGSTSGQTGIPTEYFYAAIVILAVVAVIAIAAALMYRSKSAK